MAHGRPGRAQRIVTVLALAREAMSVTGIAAAIQDKPDPVGKTLARLRDSGHVSWTPDPTDQRVHRYTLTTRGWQDLAPRHRQHGNDHQPCRYVATDRHPSLPPSTVVSALQFTGSPRNIDAVQRLAGRAVRRAARGATQGWYLTAHHTTRIHDGDWIVINPAGHPQLLSDEVFGRVFDHGRRPPSTDAQCPGLFLLRERAATRHRRARRTRPPPARAVMTCPIRPCSGTAGNERHRRQPPH
jgi:DNA-binding MarR family transcriptional regulator